MTEPPPLAIIMPVLDEGPTLAAALEALRPLRARGIRLIVVDGGSADDSVTLARPLADGVITARRGRSPQQNAGAAESDADTILFLHSDTRLPHDADALVAAALAAGHDWGRFDLRIEGRHRMLGVIARSMNIRSHLTGIVTGDQCIFVRRELFEQVGGFPDIALMEDIAISKLLRRRGRPARIRVPVTTSGRRWERAGVWRTIFAMWRNRIEFQFGADPDRLAARYGYRPSERD